MGSWLECFSVPPEGLLHDDAVLACLIHGCLLHVPGDDLIDGAGQSRVESWPVALGGRSPCGC